MHSFYNDCIGILKEELVPAMGCTEPISLAYGGAVARDLLNGEVPERIIARCSRNFLKNVMCVKVPNTGGMIGVEAAVAAGICGGISGRKMEVISELSGQDLEKVKDLLSRKVIKVEMLETETPLHYILEVYTGSHAVVVEIKYRHTRIERICVDGKDLDLNQGAYVQKTPVDRSILSVSRILDFAEHVPLDEVADLVRTQAEDNFAIAREGMKGRYGVDIGNLILSRSGESTVSRMLAYTAAASETRMEGCPLAVVINSGSGNQGIASSVPIVIYCRDNGIPEEKMYRALILSNLLTIHQKSGIGELSAFCGAVCASVSAAAAVTYLKGGGLEEISQTITNSYGGVVGTICDGAKATCGFKICGALSAALLAGDMALRHRNYAGRTGIIRPDVESSIKAIGRLGREGMVSTDKKILEIMLEQ